VEGDTFKEEALPTGDEGDTMVIWVAYYNYIEARAEEMHIGGAGEQEITMQFMQINTEEDYDDPLSDAFNNLRNAGNMPLFCVIIVKDMVRVEVEEDDGAQYAQILGPDAAGATFGNFKIYIKYVNPNPGTFITNDDITTGVVRNAYWTSVLDLRPYTGATTTWGSKGQGRLVIDGPSQYYDRDQFWTGDPIEGYSRIGDPYGSAWWNFFNQFQGSASVGDQYYKVDTKLLIGRPYVDGLETVFDETGATRANVEHWGDEGYLWFYRSWVPTEWTWDDGVPTPVALSYAHMGTLELGGTLRVKQRKLNRELLVGMHYVYELGPQRWIRNTASSMIYYNAGEDRGWDAPAWITGDEEDDSGPQMLCRISEKFEVFDWTVDPVTEDALYRAVLIGRYIPGDSSVADLIQSDPALDRKKDEPEFIDMGINIYDISEGVISLITPLLVKLGGEQYIEAEDGPDPATAQHYLSTPFDTDIDT